MRTSTQEWKMWPLFITVKYQSSNECSILWGSKKERERGKRESDYESDDEGCFPMRERNVFLFVSRINFVPSAYHKCCGTRTTCCIVLFFSIFCHYKHVKERKRKQLHSLNDSLVEDLSQGRRKRGLFFLFLWQKEEQLLLYPFPLVLTFILLFLVL